MVTLPPEVAALATRLKDGLAELQLDLDGRQQTQCLQHLALVAQWGRVYNLTAVRGPAEMLTHHLLDCLAAVGPLRAHLAAKGLTSPRILDVGSGAGFPGVVLALALPQASVVCVDTVAKKAAFIQQAALSLGLGHLSGVHARVERLTMAPFDVVTSRAFASLVDFCALTRFHVKPDGCWMALKGRVPTDELAALPPSVRVGPVVPLAVPQLDAERCLVWMTPAAS